MNREQSATPSEASVGSQVSCDSVDPTSRVADEFANLVEEYLEKLHGTEGKGKALMKKLSRFKAKLQKPKAPTPSSSSAKPLSFSPEERCINALLDFQDVLALWDEYRLDEKKHRRQTRKERRVERALERLQKRGVNTGLCK